ncbi:MAG: fibronectin type III domain-containing protein [Jatrophihabitantaceae bacterium]
MTGQPTKRSRRISALLLAALTALGLATVASRASAATAGSPYGQLLAVTQVGTQSFAVSGWAVDNDTTGPLYITTTRDGTPVFHVLADKPSPAVPARYGNHGAAHGFAVTMWLPMGRHTVCVVAGNRGATGSNARIGCKALTVANNPVGSLDVVRQSPGTVAVYGRASDPNSAAPIGVDIWANGKLLPGRMTANAPANGRFRGYYPLADGTYSICAVAVNVSWGNNTRFPCRTITLNFNPVGAITSLKAIAGGFSIAGWATDPDENTALTVAVILDGTRLDRPVANRPGGSHSGHSFAASYHVPAGSHNVCIYPYNVRFGESHVVDCARITLNYTPRVSITQLEQSLTGLHVVGQANDPDTTAAIPVLISLNGAPAVSMTAGQGSNGHAFSRWFTAGPGQQTVCVIAKNVLYGTSDSPRLCQRITLNFDPVGAFQKLYRVGTNVRVEGWAFDPGSVASIDVQPTLDGKVLPIQRAKVARADVAAAHRGVGPAHGFAFTLPANDGEHTVCVTALNVGSGANKSLGCHIIIAVHPKVTSAPLAVTATGGYGGAIVTWTAPANDGGAPASSYLITSVPGNISLSVGSTARAGTIVGLRPSTRYSFRVVARNVAGTSPTATSPAITTEASPPPQTSPAPVSTSRYIRNIRGSSSAELAMMRSEGAADARANPSGHGYLILLDIGGQDQQDQGVVLSATTRFVAYTDLVRDVQAYVDGYASAQRASAPVMIAIGTNNDMEVSYASGAGWANSVVDPVVSYARKYSGIRIAGANDIEPGFRGTPYQSQLWLNGYLASTSAAFVFNGSADGCAWTVTGRGCNNGWTMGGLYHLAAGAAPTRTINLPQIYNSTMARQWKYISLTGVAARQPRINFGGALTEWTACDQASGCFSLSGHSAWSELWGQLQSASQLRVGSLPYSTDLRIDR